MRLRCLVGRYAGTVLLPAAVLGAAGCRTDRPPVSASFPVFRHHFITTTLPGEGGWGYGLSELADYDRDGDLDYTMGVRGEGVFWFEFRPAGGADTAAAWVRHDLGPMPVVMLGGVSMDVDRDGHVDLVTGGAWYRNPGDPANRPFERYVYDPDVDTEIHDLALADLDGDGRDDLVVLGDKEGCFWYRIPEAAPDVREWTRTLITDAVLDTEDDIHSGFFPGGAGDLDDDGDPDLVLPDRWLENRDAGRTWVAHPLPFGKRGPWGLSARSWIADLDDDGDADLVLLDSDQAGSGGVWLESDGARSPAFEVHPLPLTAPGTRGSFHSLAVADFDGDGDLDIFTAEQEDTDILPEGAPPRWYIWEHRPGETPRFVEHVVFDGRLGGHDARVGDIDGDGDPDLCAKIWSVWPENANGGRAHADCLENLLIP